jgi:hypothetical protein
MDPKSPACGLGDYLERARKAAIGLAARIPGGVMDIIGAYLIGRVPPEDLSDVETVAFLQNEERIAQEVLFSFVGAIGALHVYKPAVSSTTPAHTYSEQLPTRGRK